MHVMMKLIGVTPVSFSHLRRKELVTVRTWNNDKN
jgi:hypothetical protein